MIPVRHIDPDDLALYAMQLLPPDEAAEMHVHLQHSAEARKVLSEVYGDLSVLAHTADVQEPSADTRQRLLKQVALEKKVIPIDRETAGGYATRSAPGMVDEVAPRSAAARILPWIGWAVAAGMLFEAGNLYQQREQLKTTVATAQTQVTEAQTQLATTKSSDELANTLMQTIKDPAAVQVTLTSSDVKPPPQGRASYVADRGSLVFLASNLAPLQPEKTYELWLIPADGQPPIAAGTFRPDERGNASVLLPKLPVGVAAKAFGVTVEESGGSTSPTLPILLQGAAS